jgi:ribosomal protein S6--L-glutamate ligase
MKKYDVIIPRANVCENVALESAILKQIEHMHIPMINSYDSIICAKNKLLTLQILGANDIPTVRTAVIHRSDNLDTALKHIGRMPMIMKTAFGSFGHGVVLIESERSARSAYDLLNRAPSNIILLQKYVRESKGKDIRIIVVGGRVIAAMERKAKRGEFRSNIKVGGEGKAIKPTREMKNLAIRATKALGLQISGVDIILTQDGPAIMEVNSNPGMEGIEEATSINVAEKMIKYAVKYANTYVHAPATLSRL